MPPNRYRQTEPPPSPDGPMSPEELAEQLGLDPSILAGGSDPFDIFASGASPEDRVGDRYIPPVGAGPQSRPVRGGFTGDDSGRGGAGMAGVIRDAIDKAMGRGSDIGPEGGLHYSTIGALLKRFYQLNPENLRRVQGLLYAAGFYGDMDVTDIRWGEADEQSFSAWAELLARTAKLNAAGKEISYNDVLSQAAVDAGIDLEVLGDLFESGDEGALEAYLDQNAGEGDLIQITLSDPNALRATMDQAASAVLGRRATPAEQQLLISTIHGIQRNGQAAMQGKAGIYSGELGGDLSGNTDIAGALGYDDSFPGGGGDQVVEYAAPDESATAEALLREQNPTEAGAHDVANQVANFLQLLNSPVDVPRLTVG